MQLHLLPDKDLVLGLELVQTGLQGSTLDLSLCVQPSLHLDTTSHHLLLVVLDLVHIYIHLLEECLLLLPQPGVLQLESGFEQVLALESLLLHPDVV